MNRYWICSSELVMRWSIILAGGYEIDVRLQSRSAENIGFRQITPSMSTAITYSSSRAKWRDSKSCKCSVMFIAAIKFQETWFGTGRYFLKFRFRGVKIDKSSSPQLVGYFCDQLPIWFHRNYQYCYEERNKLLCYQYRYHDRNWWHRGGRWWKLGRQWI